MRKFFLVTAIIVIASISTFAQEQGGSMKKALTSAAPDMLAEAKTAIAKGNARWSEAWAKGDPAMVADLFMKDGMILAGSGKIFKGRDQILDRQKAGMQSVGRDVKVTATTINVWLDGETAYETGTYDYKYLENGKPTEETGKYVTIWKRQKDGSWKLFMDMGVPQD